jgi:transcriptional regulator with XRE-family HTH domain
MDEEENRPPTDAEIGQCIEYMRVVRGFSQTELANLLGCRGHQAAYRIKKGSTHITEETLGKVASALNPPQGFFEDPNLVPPDLSYRRQLSAMRIRIARRACGWSTPDFDRQLGPNHGGSSWQWERYGVVSEKTLLFIGGLLGRPLEFFTDPTLDVSKVIREGNRRMRANRKLGGQKISAAFWERHAGEYVAGNPVEIGSLIRQTRKACRVGSNVLSKRLGICRERLGKIERGVCRIRVDELGKLCKSLKLGHADQLRQALPQLSK